MRGAVPFVTGDGSQTRDYIYVTDTARISIDIYKNKDTRGKIINLGSGTEINILDLVSKIVDLTDYDKKIEFRNPRIGDVERLVADVSLATNLLGFEQQVDFEEGIKHTIDWYKNTLLEK
jgi:UDP-glucose 4-epimerase